MEKKLAVAKITAPHGLRGEVKAVSFSGEMEHLLTLTTVEIEVKGKRQYFNIEHLKGSAEKMILKLENINNVEDAAGLSGAELWVNREDAAKLEENEYYFADLCGCAVEYGGYRKGTVVSVCEGANDELLEIALSSGGTIYIPFREVYVGVIDIENRRIEIIEDWFFQ